MNSIANRLGKELKNLLPAAAALSLSILAAPAVQAQQSGSLADAARQARAQKQAAPHADSTAQQLADQLADDQNDNGAPGGFKTYNAGDYKVWVPAPYRVEGHDSAGVVLSGPMIGGKVPMVLLGTPIANRFGNDDAAFQDTATQFSHVYAESTSCTKAAVANHSAFECGLAAATLLGKRVSGNAMFLRSGSKIYPVFCMTPTDSWSRDVVNNAHASYRSKAQAQENLKKEDDDIKTVMQKCETVFQSIHIAEVPSSQPAVAVADGSAPASAPAVSANAPAPPASAPKAASSGDPAASGPAAQATASQAPASLADVARGLHAPRAQDAPATNVAVAAAATPQSALPEGVKAHPFTYCKSRSQCFDASVLVPADAQLISSSCKQYIFQVKVQGTPFLLLAGPAGGEGCVAGSSGQVSWNELAAPDNQRAPGTFSTIGSQQTTIDGKAAVIIQMGLRKGAESWMAKRAEIESNGVALVVGCLGRRDHFADADTVCSNWIESLRLP
jgi:hypothetical protein